MVYERTLIDVLRKGNEELFHSSVLAWLFDAKAEHGLGDQVLRRFAEEIAQEGYPELLDLVGRGNPEVHTERAGRTGRYDLVVEVDGDSCILENKVKSLGSEAQLLEYGSGEGVACVVPLGLTRATFRPEVPNVITYNVVRDVLDEVQVDRSNDFQVLIDHYRRYLAMQLDLFTRVDTCYANGDFKDSHAELTKDLTAWALSTDNDRRVINQYVLEIFRSSCLASGPYEAGDWHSHKDEQSGAWLAGTPAKFQPHKSYLPAGHPDTKFWVHIELHSGPYAEDPGDHAGEIQLRASTSGSNRELLEQVQVAHSLNPSERFNSRMDDRWGSFFVVARSLRKQDLVVDQLSEALGDFLNGCGELN